MSCWGAVPAAAAAAAAPSLTDLMSEQLCEKLSTPPPAPPAAPTATEPVPPPSFDVDEDYALALKLQDEERVAFAREQRARGATSTSSGSKVRVQTRFQMNVSERFLQTGDDAGTDDPDDDDDPHLDDATQLDAPDDFAFATKHDPVLSGRLNHLRLEADIGGGTTTSSKPPRLSNPVANALKEHFRAQRKQGGRVAREHFATREHALDRSTHLLLFKLLGAEGGIASVTGQVAAGKEAVVYHATGEAAGSEFAVKVFKTTLTDFKRRGEYLEGDHRFRYVKKITAANFRSVVRVWAEKEVGNLTRAARAGLPTAEVLLLKQHVIVMAFLGRDGVAAPQLRQVAAQLGRKRLRDAFCQVAAALWLLRHEAALVHADLSGYNVLLWNGRCHVIDMGQSVALDHPRADAFLAADCANVAADFRRYGLRPAAEAPRRCDALLESEGLLAFVRDAEAFAEMPPTDVGGEYARIDGMRSFLKERLRS